ncbi:diguanylate cyclase [Vibrio sp. Of7-15]|uniref:diguanylate cyclase domain-containing protein n=1 Tax=Vibrio sp. Of7-15 TaxID=2724879 RepID=UPI001EF21ECA|nr:diguanylate cyclase [Vibrio sp. Of7-15]MCG7495712.1 diguanylate cyclase [Vibrio sp. Of7-15]
MNYFIHRLSLRQKLSIPILAFTFCVFCSFQIYTYYTTIEYEKKSLIERVQVLANGVAVNMQAALLFDDKYAAEEVLSAFKVDKEIVKVVVWDIKSDESFVTYQEPSVSFIQPNELEAAEIRSDGVSIGSNFLYILLPVTVGTEQLAMMRITVSLERFTQGKLRLFQTSTLLFVILLLLGLCLIQRIQNWVITPVTDLIHAMRGVIEHRGDFVRPVVRTEDELGELVDCFNTMLDKLHERERQVHYTLDKLAKEKAYADDVIQTVQHALLAVNNKGTVDLANEASGRVFKQSPTDLIDQSFLSIVNPSEPDKNLLQQAFHGTIFLDDTFITSTDSFGKSITYSMSSKRLADKEQILFAIEDVTEKQRAIRRQKLAAGVFENSQDGLIILTPEGVVTMTNPAVTRLLGYSQQELHGKKLRSVFECQQFAALADDIAESLERYGQWQGELWERHKNGGLVPMFVKATKIHAEQHTEEDSIVLMASDMSTVKEVERLDHMAHHDSLTGLANRAKLHQVLDKTIHAHLNTHAQFAVLYLDLDGFKLVNDTFGHDAGDLVLKAVAQRLCESVRSTDTVARLAGDEFVILIDYVDNEKHIKALVTRMLESLKKPMFYKNEAMFVGASIGVNIVTGGKRYLQDELLKAADGAMYHAKMSGKGRYHMIHFSSDNSENKNYGDEIVSNKC